MEEETEHLELMELSDGRVLLMTSEYSAGNAKVTGITLTSRECWKLIEAPANRREMVLENKRED
jgi:hypothetical protein